jgi:hypothetical protein
MMVGMSTNYPWSGKLKRFRCCIYCGQNGPQFKFSSFANRCLAPTCGTGHAKPDPELEVEFAEWTEQQARKWCKENGVDYEACVSRDLADKEI